jgi:hypothetical protein
MDNPISILSPSCNVFVGHKLLGVLVLWGLVLKDHPVHPVQTNLTRNTKPRRKPRRQDNNSLFHALARIRMLFLQ